MSQSTTDIAEDFRRRLLKNTPDSLGEDHVTVTHDVEEMTGEMETYITVLLPRIPQTNLDENDREALDHMMEQKATQNPEMDEAQLEAEYETQVQDLLDDKESYAEEIVEFRNSVTAVVDALANGDNRIRIHGYGKFEPTQAAYDYTYYVVEFRD